jgi:hypothetical protein
VFYTSALYRFPGESEADAWLTAQTDRLRAAAESGTSAVREVTDAPTFGDASAAFATRRPIGAGEETAGGFRLYARIGAIVAVIETGSVPDMPLDAATSLMKDQVACVNENGCGGLAQLPAGVFAGERPARQVEEPAAGEAAATATPAPAIIVEGGGAGAEATAEPTNEPRATRVPKEERERRRDRDNAQQPTPTS